MRQVDILVYYSPGGLCSSRGTTCKAYEFFARTIDDETNGRYEFQEWGFDFFHAADKVRRDYIKFYSNLSKRKRANITKGETTEQDIQCLKRWKTDDLVFVYYYVDKDYYNNEGMIRLERKQVLFPRGATIEEMNCFYDNLKFPEFV